MAASGATALARLRLWASTPAEFRPGAIGELSGACRRVSRGAGEARRGPRRGARDVPVVGAEPGPAAPRATARRWIARAGRDCGAWLASRVVDRRGMRGDRVGSPPPGRRSRADYRRRRGSRNALESRARAVRLSDERRGDAAAYASWPRTSPTIRSAPRDLGDARCLASGARSLLVRTTAGVRSSGAQETRTDKPLAQRAIGGLGIHLVRKMPLG